MTLRLRMTLLSTTITGGILFIFGVLVYVTVSLILLDQVDATLIDSSSAIISNLRVDPSNQFDVTLVKNFQSVDNLTFQVWGDDQNIQISFPPGQTAPLDTAGYGAGKPMLNTRTVNGESLRVFSIPIQSTLGPAGVLQVGLSIRLMEYAQQILAITLIVLAVIAILQAGLATWLVIRRSLRPLETVTQLATQITRADDLSRRIPQSGDMTDEVGQLIEAFNSTLERLEHLFSAQRRMLADVSHELRTPLTVIKGNISLVRRIGEADPESLESIEAEVDRLTRMVGDLLLLAQVESGKLVMDKMLVELDTLLLEVYQQMKVLAGSRVTLQLLDIDQVQVIGDRDRLKQVLLNLISNAVQYTPQRGKVTLTLTRQEGQAKFVVSDTGPGIPAEDLPHIFERFYRGEKSRSRGIHGGFGLGLSIVYWIVRNHGGSIEVESAEGEGTIFTILLPLAGQKDDRSAG
jgi:two-component system OmpR family sensor kinase